MKVGRNDPCPCGSDRKYKQCCALKVEGPTGSPAKGLPWRFGLLVILGLGAFLWVIDVWGNSGPELVWSEEHGHWHDAATGMEPTSGTIPPPPQGSR